MGYRMTDAGGRGPGGQGAAVALAAALLLTGAAGGSAADPDWQAIADGVRVENLRAHVEALAACGSRIPGYPGEEQAAAYLRGTLTEIGFADVREETFPITVPVEESASLELPEAGRTFALHALWPNLVRTAQLPPDGVSGQAVDGGRGEWADFNGKQIRDAVVFMDFNSDARWINAAMLGARAVVFVEPEHSTCRQAELKFTGVPLSLPRFWISTQDYRAFAASGFGRTVRLRCRMAWRVAQARNLSLRIEGSDPELKDKLICLETYYDSMSIVPALAPGAESACGIAALLEIARVLKAEPPGCSVLLLAVSGHHLYNSGITAFIDEHARRRSPFRERLAEPIHPDLMLCLDLTSRNETLGVTYADSRVGRGIIPAYQRYRNEMRPHAELFTAYADTLSPVLGRATEDICLNVVLPKTGGSWRTLIPEEIALDSVVALAAATPAVTLITVQDPRVALDTPLDRPSDVNFGNLAAQAKFLACSLVKALADPEMLAPTNMEEDSLRLFKGRLVTFDPHKSFIPDDPVVGALGHLLPAPVGKPRPAGTGLGVRREMIVLTDEGGRFECRGLLGGECSLAGYALDPESGAVVMAMDLGLEGIQQYPVDFLFDAYVKERTAVLFDCRSTDLYDIVDPRYLIPMSKLLLFDPGNSQPFAFGYTLHARAPSERTSEAAPYASLFVKPGVPIKVGVSSDLLGQRMLFLNSPSAGTRKESEGLGYKVGSMDVVRDAPYQVLRDMHNLNEHRIRTVRRYGIESRRLERLHAAAGEALVKAGEAREKLQWDAFIRYARRGLGIESRAYPDVRATSDDVVKGIVFYMALLLPFAYFCERLFFAFPDLKRRIIAFVGLFMVTYLALRLVHPAFKIVETSEVILLGLVILALCSIVVFISAGRFEAQMRMLKQQRGKVHQTDVSRASATATAFALGVSNMRRRRVRTFLTCAAIVLLMFTVLSFTSVKTFLRSRKLPRLYAPTYQGALVRDRTWVPMKYLSLEHLDSELADVAVLARRSWLSPKNVSQDFTQLAILLRSMTDAGPGSERIRCYGVVGFEAAEQDVSGIDRTLLTGRWFKDGERDVCVVPDAIAEALGIDPSDVGTARIQVLGATPTVIGIVDSRAYNDFRDLDDETLTPLDYTRLSRDALNRASAAGGNVSAIEGRAPLETFAHIDARNTVLMPYERVLDLGGTLQSVAMQSRTGKIGEHIDRLLDRLAVTVFVGEGERVMVYSSLAASSIGGMGNILVPVLIAALMVLNTMSGSVHERLKEIGTYSSVGLAPSHIGALFLAEACVYAILGGISGYVIGQIVTKVLGAFGGLKGLTLNYSSLASVLATLIVMVTVILSTVYPARMASRMAVPDVTRRWKIPPPDGDDWTFDFPFTVGGKEVSGLYVFFRYYFASFEEQSVGRFYTSSTELSSFADTDGAKGYRLCMRAWLSPYDLGVSQDVELRAVPTGVAGVYSIQLRIQRLSGQANTWVRINRGFLNEIRKQFLLWRTITPESKAEYTAEAEEVFG